MFLNSSCGCNSYGPFVLTSKVELCIYNYVFMNTYLYRYDQLIPDILLADFFKIHQPQVVFLPGLAIRINEHHLRFQQDYFCWHLLLPYSISEFLNSWGGCMVLVCWLPKCQLHHAKTENSFRLLDHANCTMRNPKIAAQRVSSKFGGLHFGWVSSWLGPYWSEFHVSIQRTKKTSPNKIRVCTKDWNPNKFQPDGRWTNSSFCKFPIPCSKWFCDLQFLSENSYVVICQFPTFPSEKKWFCRLRLRHCGFVLPNGHMKWRSFRRERYCLMSLPKL